eukprot:scaffold319722_cov33-Prasinocladus_malaysianus.AAC.2
MIRLILNARVMTMGGVKGPCLQRSEIDCAAIDLPAVNQVVVAEAGSSGGVLVWHALRGDPLEDETNAEVAEALRRIEHSVLQVSNWP